MLSNLRTIGKFLVPKTNTRVLRYLLANQLCTVIEESPEVSVSPEISESPEIPSWAKLKSAEEDIFVIPSLADWVDSHKPQKPREAVDKAPSEPVESDADKIGKVVKGNKYKSPEDVSRALKCVSLENLSDATVEQVLKRFNCVWVPAFGVFKWAKAQTNYKHTPDLYNLMVDILGKCKQFELMWELVEEMNDLEGYVSLVTMTKVMRRLSRARMYKEAVDAFRGIKGFGVERDIFAMNAIMEALIKENGVEHANEVFLEFKGSIRPNDRTFNILIHGWCIVGNFDRARKTMEDMEKHGFPPDVYSYTCLIEGHANDLDFRRVSAVQQEMKERGLKPSIVTYTIVMHSLGKARQIDEALKIYEKMKENGVKPDAGFYSSVIYMLGKAGRLNDVDEVFDDMIKQGVTPNVDTYTTMITCACVHSREDMALSLLKKMEENSCQPKIETYAPLLKMCCAKKRMKILYFLLDHMFSNDVGIQLGTYSLLITGLCKVNKLKEACFFFEDMVSKGIVPEETPYERLRNQLVVKNMIEKKEKIDKLMSQAKLSL